MKRWILGMRDAFFTALFEIAKNDKKVILLTSDTGAICHDRFRKELKNQYINVGIAEQNMIGVAAGLAMTGKNVYVYAIVPFVTMRCYEQIRVDLCCMNLTVTVIGIGAGFDYSTLGPTHHGVEDISIMRNLPDIKIYSPADSLAAKKIANITYKERGPKYVRLDRVGFPLVYKNNNKNNFTEGFNIIKKGKQGYIIATGRMVHTALKVVQKLSKYGIEMGIIDLFKIEPLDNDKFLESIVTVKYIVTVEEHFIFGGIGSIVGELLINNRDNIVFKKIGILNGFCREYGTREYLHRLNKIDDDSITESIKKWIKNKKQ
ncbi:MAG: transketolase [Candidatus Omnitrophica bacterium]|nr:transketolase [Candidatus Omnitrophota bacterium]